MAEFKAFRAGASESEVDQFLAYLFAQDSAGIATDGVLAGLAVTQTTTASGSVLIGLGAVVVQDTLLAAAKPLVSNAQKTLDVLGPNPMGALPRNDLVVFDSATSSIRNIVGTPNASPTDPTVPATAVKLARLRHAASATTVPSSKIDDLRVFTGLKSSIKDDTGWGNLPITAGGWTDPSGVRWQARMRDGVVHFRGTITNSAFTGGWTAVLTLPTGVTAPAGNVALTLGSNTGSSRGAYVDTTGVVFLYASAASAAWWTVGGSYPVG